MRICTFEGCVKKQQGHGLCPGHLAQKRRGWPELKPLRVQVYRSHENASCSFSGCDRPWHCKDLCVAHYAQMKKGKPLQPIKTQYKRGSGPPGGIIIKLVDKYERAYVWPDHPYYEYAHEWGSHSSARWMAHHRLVVAHSLGRRLLPTETVHHIDGDRCNNTLGNLQLRHGRHGNGKKIICADCGSHNTVAVELD